MYSGSLDDILLILTLFEYELPPEVLYKNLPIKNDLKVSNGIMQAMT